MTPFPILNKQSNLDDKQKEFWDFLTLGERGFYTGGPDSKRVPDLYNAYLQFPGFGRRMMEMGGEVRTGGKLPGKLREIIVLLTSVQLGARVEYDFHIPFARDAGLSDALIEAIGKGETPPFGDDAERITYEANKQLLDTAGLTEKTREEAIALLGFDGVMHLIASVVLYVSVAYTTNVARVKLADDFSADPNQLKNFFGGRTSAS